MTYKTAIHLTTTPFCIGGGGRGLDKSILIIYGITINIANVL